MKLDIASLIDAKSQLQAYRGDAFSACEFIIDYLKTRAPLWKKEDTPNGARWVEARATDDAAAERWQTPREPAK